MLRAIIICSVLAISLSAHAELILDPVHPDEPADYTYNERFSTRSSLESLNAIKSALESFRKLTEASAGKIPKKTLAKIGNTGWEMQNLGFPNHVGAVKGTLLKQEYLIKKLTYELAQSKAREVSKEDLSEAKKDCEKAEKQFQDYWDSFSVSD
ncbi:MAG: hypothetical protein CVU64_19925 [Deltaproteobacteria bacterium HGW-Deltaproteobacteria-21]|nr:MAG: hypothetical protein CVU64_19925 [Deltaproteobacteria bacterium HGW-Deltaproteobacteria-21]